MFKKIAMGVLNFLGSLFTVRAGQQSTAGHATYTSGDPLAALREDLAAIVAKLADMSLSGRQKFETAFHTLKAIAIERGVEAVDWALTELIEKEVTAVRGDPLEQVLDQGLETARQVVLATDANAIANGDTGSREAAVVALKDKLLNDGKSWLLSTHTLNLLIAAAVSKIMAVPRENVN